jgi:hypothetical protein
MNKQIDSSIPVLTDIIHPSDDQKSTPSQFITSPQSMVSVPLHEPLPIKTFPNLELLKLEQSIKEQVLNQVFTRVDHILENDVRKKLISAIQISIDDLVASIRTDLERDLEGMIGQAIKQELNKLK